MVISKMVIEHMINASESLHGGIPFWKVYLVAHSAISHDDGSMD